MLENNITKRKQAEEELSETKEYLENLIKYANAPIIVWDPTLSITLFNRAFEHLSGYKASEVIGKKINFLFSKNKMEGALEQIQKTASGERWESIEIEIKRKDGQSRIVLWNSAYILDAEKKNIIATIAQGQDITERKQAEDELQESNVIFKEFMENSPNYVFFKNDKIQAIRLSRNYEKMFGKPMHKLLGKTMDDLFPSNLAKSMIADDLRILNEGKQITVEEELNGRFYTTIKFPILIKGKPRYLAGYTIDITERRQAEERIKHLNLVLRAIRNINQLISQENDRKRLIKGVCKSLTETSGYYHSWIVLLDQEGKIDTHAETGLGKEFLPMLKQLKKGELTAIGRLALKKRDVVIIKDPASACPDCPLAQEYSGRGAMTIRLEHSGKVYGIMSVSIPAHFIPDKEEQSLLKEVAGDIALGLHSIEMKEKLDEYTHHLKERVKEFNFLFQLSQLLEKTDISLEVIIQKLTGLLPAAWQYPKITCVRITFEGKEYKTENFKKTIWKLSKDIKIDKKIIGVLEVYYLKERPEMDKGPFLKEEKDLITIIAQRLGSFIDRKSSVIQLQQSYQKIKIAMDATIETMSKIIEVKDPYTAGHQQRVSQLAIAIAKELDLSQDKVDGIRVASLIHDIGKISIPTEILSKSTVLSDIEFNLIKEHSQIGYDILKAIDFSYPVAKIVLQHHERINGSGYPNQLKGDEIFLEAKILGVADVVEAMSSHRPYRPALGIDAALEEISKNKGILYGSEVVDACLKLFKEKGFKF